MRLKWEFKSVITGPDLSVEQDRSVTKKTLVKGQGFEHPNQGADVTGWFCFEAVQYYMILIILNKQGCSVTTFLQLVIDFQVLVWPFCKTFKK